MLTVHTAERVLDYLIESLFKAGLDKEVDFLVYGSIYGDWRDGLSDLDGVMFFKNHSPTDAVLRESLNELQKRIKKLYTGFPNIKTGFLTDIFVVDGFHSQDGRFVFPFDDDWVRVFWKDTLFKFIHGSRFVDSIKTVSLRNQNEFELAMGLSVLRNYLLFELPRTPETMSISYAKNILKFFKVLPRTSTIILGLPMSRQPNDLNNAWGHFSQIDFSPLISMSQQTAEYSGTIQYLKLWHTNSGRKHFTECLYCFEQTLKALVHHAPMRSKVDP